MLLRRIECMKQCRGGLDAANLLMPFHVPELRNRAHFQKVIAVARAANKE
jgi:hypothetical protein